MTVKYLSANALFKNHLLHYYTILPCLHAIAYGQTSFWCFWLYCSQKKLFDSHCIIFQIFVRLMFQLFCHIYLVWKAIVTMILQKCFKGRGMLNGVYIYTLYIRFDEIQTPRVLPSNIQNDKKWQPLRIMC